MEPGYEPDYFLKQPDALASQYTKEKNEQNMESMAKKVKGTDAAVHRDQLIGLMGGF